MRRIIPVLLALLLALGLPLTVLAAEGEGGGEGEGGILAGVLEGLKNLFIPDEDFFEDFNYEIQEALNKTTGGLVKTFYAITDAFYQLQGSKPVNNSLKLTMPDNLLFNGYKGTTVNLLGGVDSFAAWFRGLSSAFTVTVTIIYCYRKVISFFKG